MRVLGISALYHDSAAALCDSGEIVAAAQEERFTRRKNDSSFPANAVEYCLREAGVTPGELDAVVFYDNPLLTLDRWVSNIVELGPDSGTMIDKSFDSIFKSRLWIHKMIENRLNGLGAENKLLVTKHHISHAASAFYPSPFKRAAILTMDGVGEWATTTIGAGSDTELSLIKEIHYPHSLGLLYSAVTYFCGFKVNSGEYKLMGLAPYGRPVYYDLMKKELIDIKPDGSYRLNMGYFDYHRNEVMTNEKFERLFGGPPRQAESDITKREMNIAASIQKLAEEVVLLLAGHAKEITGEKNLVLAGGVALNCVANGKLLLEGIFDNLWIQPASGDAGGALGAALYATHAHFKVPRVYKNNRDIMKGAYLGPSFSMAQIKETLDAAGAVYTVYDDKSSLYREAAKQIANGAVLGFFSGRMEYGPRALGARSILADPRKPDTQAKLNLKIKYRESFRPFAPSVLAEKAGAYFKLSCESPYMLLVAGVADEIRKDFNLSDYTGSKGDAMDMLPIVNVVRSDIPAVTHVDYSARIQTVHKLDNEDYYSIISEFERQTGCAVVVNTSFNVRGEPIVCTPKDAYLCFMRTEMDVLIMENLILFKHEQPALADDDNWRDEYGLD